MLTCIGCTSYRITSEPSGAMIKFKSPNMVSWDAFSSTTPCKVTKGRNWPYGFEYVTVKWADGNFSDWRLLDKDMHFVKDGHENRVMVPESEKVEQISQPQPKPVVIPNELPSISNFSVKGHEEAETYLLKVFNNHFTIKQNNAQAKTSFELDNSKVTFTSTVTLGGHSATEKEVCELEYLDPNRIETSMGSINIWTKNEERRVVVSALPQKQWAISLLYDKDTYSESQIISSFKTILSNSTMSVEPEGNQDSEHVQKDVSKKYLQRGELIPEKEFLECATAYIEGCYPECNYTVRMTRYTTDAVLLDMICKDRDVALFADASRISTFTASGLYGLLEGVDIRPKEFDIRVITRKSKLVGTAHYSPILQRVKWISGFK